MNKKLRQAMGETAVKIAKEITDQKIMELKTETCSNCGISNPYEKFNQQRNGSQPSLLITA